jgi:serine/threonine-protein kinase RsbT
MDVTQSASLPIFTEEDIVKVRLAVRLRAVEMRFSIVDQTKIVTAASELARNTLTHGGGGEATISIVTGASSLGIKLDFVDAGQGITDVKLALTDGYSTGQGLGLGLSGSKRLMSEFELETHPGKGTRVTVIKWK